MAFIISCVGALASSFFFDNVRSALEQTHLYQTFDLNLRPVTVKGGMSLRNDMWHGSRNDIIMRNVIYAE